MTREEIQAQVDAFFASGGKVTTVAAGERTIDDGLRFCRCGCHGDYTEHSMRAGESGRSASIIIQG